MGSASRHWYPTWTPRFWHGMRFGTWIRLLAENRFAIAPSRLPMAAILTMVTPVNSVLSWVQRLRHHRAIASVEIEHPPLFIVGHWRSGTTLLHELLVHDARLNYPTTYQCFAPHHFLISQSWLPKLTGFLLPKKRPMDDMEAGWNRPQEDEFALMSLGSPTPYRRIAFPNRGPVHTAFLDLDKVDARQSRRWQESLLYFVRALTYGDPRRLVLKSPPHTGRVGHLARLFPGAQFIHIARDPRALFPSTRRLWKSLGDVQGIQRPHNRDLDDYIFLCFERMYDAFWRQRRELAPGQIAYTRYEDLIADPVGEVGRIYQELELGDFDDVAPRIERHMAARSDYRPNVHELEPELQASIRERWRPYCEAFGYEV